MVVLIVASGARTLFVQAKALGDVLIVGLNSDESVKKIKGSHRPINNQEFRSKMLLGLKACGCRCDI